MDIIYNETIKDLSPLVAEYGKIMGSISKEAHLLREKFLKDGTIVRVPALEQSEAGTLSLCAIDGASGSEKMQSADLLIAGSTLHEGLNSKPVFDMNSDDRPYAHYADIRLHTARSDQILSSMRAFTEIAVLGEAPHNITIIDGSYLGNFLTVLYQLQESHFTAEKIIEFLQKDTEKSFLKGVSKILDVNKQDKSDQMVVALAKSDSSREMVKRHVGNSDFFATDKMLAEYLVKPGEMLVPADVRSNIDKVGMLEKHSKEDRWAGFRWDPKRTLSDRQFSVLAEFFDGVDGIMDKDLFSLYTYLYDFKTYQYTYFKPHKFAEGSSALRLEFTHIDSGNTKSLIDRAQLLTSHIDADIINPTVKEPYSQYMVDRDVKRPVSTAIKFYKANMARELRNIDGVHLSGVTSGYRT